MSGEACSCAVMPPEGGSDNTPRVTSFAAGIWRGRARARTQCRTERLRVCIRSRSGTAMPAQKLADKHSLKIMNMEPTAIPPNNSHQHLMNECDVMDGRGERRVRVTEGVTRSQWITVAILCFVNLINYMDRYTIAGILTDIQDYFNVKDKEGGLLQTAFVLSYMLFAPIFGYMGDRYNRRYIMAAGVFLWCLTTFIGSYMKNYYWFLLFRTLVGIGEASYSTIAPTIISDLFVHDMRSKMLALFYFAIPVGSGMGYIVGSETAKAAGGLWQAGLRVTPALGIVAVILIVFLMVDPVRGGAEGKTHISPTTWSQDIKHLVKNKSFMLSTAGFTCVAFVTGALAWWGPTFVLDGLRMQPGNENVQLSDVSFKFGAVAMVSGLIGVPLGALLAQKLRPRMPRADPFICAFGLLVSAPLIFGALITASIDETTCYILIFFGEVALNLNWSIVADILLYVVVPTRRSTAEAFQILFSHAFGDAGSPYLIGVISDKLKTVLGVGTATAAVAIAATSGSRTEGVSTSVEFHSFQYALFLTCFVEVLGGLFFLLNALFIIHDKEEACREVSGMDNPVVPTHLYADDPQLNRSEINLTVA